VKRDLAKIFQEPERSHAWKWQKGALRAQQGVDPDDLPTWESMHKPWLGERKIPRQKTSVLARMMRSFAGRPWDAVYAEISAVCDRRNYGGYTLHEAVKGLVAESVYLVDGVPFDAEGKKILHEEVWVHPETGILMRTERSPRRRYQRREIYQQVVINHEERYVNVDDIWYRVKFSALSSVPAFDVILKHDVSLSRTNWLSRDCWHGLVYASEKRQIGKKEIRKLIKQISAVTKETER
jgi:hypothetical protein